MSRRFIAPLLGLILIAAAGSHSPVLKGSFLAFDDDAYITNNPKVSDLKSENLTKILTQTHLGQYVPLTLFVLAVERRFFGDSPLGYHAISLMLHLLNAVLVYLVFFRWSGYPLKALGTAALFALHPLAVEPVAWISSTKDLLCTALMLGSILFYDRFKDRADARDYAPAMVLGVLALLAKSAAASLPVLFVFLEIRKGRSVRSAVFRSLPLIVAVGIIAGVDVWATPGSTLASSWLTRPLNIAFAPLFYLAKIVYPVGLSCIYPRPEHAPGGWPLAYTTSPALLAAAALIVFRLRRDRPDIFFGASLFMIFVLPMLPFFRFGPSMVADRYVYLASTGIYFAVSSVFHEWLGMGFFCRVASGVFFTAWLGILSAATFDRAGAWRDGVTLMTDSIRQYPWSAFSYYVRGNHHAGEGRFEEAEKDYAEAIRLRPDAPPAYRALEEVRARGRERAHP